MLIPRRVFEIARAGYTRKEAQRYAIDHIQLSRDVGGSPWAAATDGIIIVAATWEEDDAGEFPAVKINVAPSEGEFSCIVPVARCKEIMALDALGARGRYAHRPILSNIALDEHDIDEEGILHFAATDLEACRRLDVRPNDPDGKGFPDWRPLVFKEREPSAEPYRIVPKYMIELLTVLKAIAGKDDMGDATRLHISSEDGGIDTRGGDAYKINVLAMEIEDEKVHAYGIIRGTIGKVSQEVEIPAPVNGSTIRKRRVEE